MKSQIRRLDILVWLMVLGLLLGQLVKASTGRHSAGDLLQWQFQEKTVHVIPRKGFHFNLKAPNQLSVDGKALRLKAGRQEIDADLPSSTVSVVSAKLYVCDNAETFCEPLSFDLNRKGVAAAKPKMFDFYAIWCPPCNQLSETVFESEAFKKKVMQFDWIKVDVDKPEASDLKAKYHITGWPTVVFTDGQGNELRRWEGTTSVQNFVSLMDDVLKLNSGSPGQDISLHDPLLPQARALLQKEDFALADQVLALALETHPTTEATDLLVTSVINEKNAQTDNSHPELEWQILKQSVQKFPGSFDLSDRLDRLAKISKTLNDKQLVAETRRLTLDAWHYVLKHPKCPAMKSMLTADVWKSIADTYDDMGHQEAYAKTAYEKAAALYAKKTAAIGQKPEQERGYNLERLYCLGKSGHEAEALAGYRQLEKAYPSEFTFYFNEARLLHRLGRDSEAKPSAVAAFANSYGDNHLRAVQLYAEILWSIGNHSDARKLVDDVINQTAAPAASAGNPSMRTNSYLAQLKDLQAKFQK